MPITHLQTIDDYYQQTNHILIMNTVNMKLLVNINQKNYHIKSVTLVFFACLLLIFTPALFGGVNNQYDKLDEKNIPIPFYARDINRYKGNGYYSGAVGFKADVKYLQKTVIKFYSVILKNKGWTECDESDWDEFFDAHNTINKGFWTRRFASFFYSPYYNKSIIISISYNTDHNYSIVDFRSKYNIKWPDFQTVGITIYDSNQTTVNSTIKNLSLKCSGKPA
jgi:hypothetical protein